MKAAILHSPVAADASKDEQDSLIQAEAVARSLAALGFEPIPVIFELNLDATSDRLREIAPELVFNLVESVNGRGRLVHLAPALLDYLRLPYSGSTTEALFTTSNKLLAKQWLQARKVAVPAWVPLSADAGAYPAFVGGAPYIIKSVWEHASIGIDKHALSCPKDIVSLQEAMAARRPLLGNDVFAEIFIDGREFNLSLLAGENGEPPEVLPPAEICFDDFPPEKPRIVDYRAKWDENSFEYHHTPRRFDFAGQDAPLLRRLTRIALKCWNIFALRGYARVDFRVDTAGQPWVLEVNANPCLSPDGGFVAAAERAGLDYNQMTRRIVGASFQ